MKESDLFCGYVVARIPINVSFASLVAGDHSNKGNGWADLVKWTFWIFPGEIGKKLKWIAKWADRLWTPPKHKCPTPNISKGRLTQSSPYLTWQWSRVMTPYKKTNNPMKAAGKSMPVYQPNQAKYSPIFSPKYRLFKTQQPCKLYWSV